MVKDHLYSKRGNLPPLHGLLFLINSKIYFNFFFYLIFFIQGRSSEVERSLMVRLVIGLILHGVDPLSYFSFQPVLHDWCNKGLGMCYPVWDGAYKRSLAVC